MQKQFILFTSLLLQIAILNTGDCVCQEFGLKAGYNHSYFGGEDSEDFGDHDSFTGAIFSSLSIFKCLSLELGLQYLRSGADGEGVIFVQFDSGIRMVRTAAIHRLDYLAIPFMIRARSPLSLGTIVPSLAVGLAPSRNLSASTDFTPSDSFARAVFEFYDEPLNRDIDNIRSTEFLLIFAVALDKQFSGHELRLQAEWTFGLTDPFNDYDCGPSANNSGLPCDEYYGLFNYGLYETTAVKLHNRSFMLTLSFIL